MNGWETYFDGKINFLKWSIKILIKAESKNQFPQSF